MSRGVFVGLLVFLFINSTGSAFQEITYATGDVLYQQGEFDGWGQLSISNLMGNKDAVAVLTLPDTTMLFAVYIAAGGSFELKGVPNGYYLLWFATGQVWNQELFRFQKYDSYERFERILHFMTKETEDSIEFAKILVTLYPVVEGDAPTLDVPKCDFPKPPQNSAAGSLQTTDEHGN